VGVVVGMGVSHLSMLYYNITDVYQGRQRGALKGTPGGVANAVNDNPGRIRSIEDHVRIWICHKAAEVALFVARPLVG